jgi:hypothetical protein
MFWFNRKEIIIDCFTPLQSVFELYKIQPAIKFFPEEFKSLPNYHDEIDDATKIKFKAATIRKCVGLQELYKRGFILPMWTNLISEPKNAALNTTAAAMVANPFSYTIHPKKQYGGVFDDYFNIKLSGVWKIREKSGIQFLLQGPAWNLHNHHKNFLVAPGVVSYNYQSQTNVNLFINKNSDDFCIDSGTPLVHMIPLTDKKVTIRNHFVEYDEYNKIGIPDEFDFIKPERYLRWVKQKEHQKQESKCPFGFGK